MGTGVGVLNSVLNGLAFSAIAPAMSDQQLLDALASKDALELTMLFNRSPAFVNQLQLMDPVAINDWWNTMSATGDNRHSAIRSLLASPGGNARATAGGQVLPEARVVSYEIDIRRMMRGKLALVIADSVAPIVARLNQVRRDHPALQRNERLVFHSTDNEALLCYSKRHGDDVVLVIVNLDAANVQSGWTALDLAALGLETDQPYQVHDLLVDRRYMWNGAHNFLRLDPDLLPGHVFAIRRRVRREQDFDYFL